MINNFLVGLVTGLGIAVFSLLIYNWAASIQQKILADNFEKKEKEMEQRLTDYIDGHDVYRNKRRK